MQGRRDAGMQGRRDAGMQGCRDAGTQGCRDAGMQGCRDAGMQGRRDAGMQGWLRAAPAQGWRMGQIRDRGERDTDICVSVSRYDGTDTGPESGVPIPGYTRYRHRYRESAIPYRERDTGTRDTDTRMHG